MNLKPAARSVAIVSQAFGAAAAETLHPLNDPNRQPYTATQECIVESMQKVAGRSQGLTIKDISGQIINGDKGYALDVDGLTLTVNTAMGDKVAYISSVKKTGDFSSEWDLFYDTPIGVAYGSNSKGQAENVVVLPNTEWDKLDKMMRDCPKSILIGSIAYPPFTIG